MNGFNFTERVRRVLSTARHEAIGLRHEYVGTEHILLALIQERDGVMAEVIQHFNVNLSALKLGALALVKEGKSGEQTVFDLPYTSGAKRVLELAMQEARELSHGHVGTEHLMLGLILEERGIAAQVMAQHGLTANPVRAEVLRLVQSVPGATPEVPGANAEVSMADSSGRADVVSVHVEIRYEDDSVARHESRSIASTLAFLQTQ